MKDHVSLSVAYNKYAIQDHKRGLYFSHPIVFNSLSLKRIKRENILREYFSQKKCETRIRMYKCLPSMIQASLQ